ncbi:hypothetical protein MMC22_008642 [Lobaria immixta]|nr:hypothetical protein [Lobaria immixta]
MVSFTRTIPPDEDRGPQLIAMYWTECTIVTIVVALRFYSRIRIKGLGLDDWTMLFTLALTLVFASLATLLAARGGTRYLYYLQVSDISFDLKLNWIILPFGFMALATAKVSVALTMLRIISFTNLWRRRFLYFCMVSTLLSSAICVVLIFVQCNPPRALWAFVPGATCWDPIVVSDYAIFTTSFASFMDFTLALLPITIIWRLHMAVQKRIGLCILLGLGILAGISAAIKTSKFVMLRQDWANFDLIAWTAAENTCLVICSSVPTLKPLYDQLFHRKHSTTIYVSPGQKPLAYPRPIQQVYSPSRAGFAIPPSSSFASAHVVDDGREGNATSFV